MKKSLLFISSILFITPCFLVSCQVNNFNNDTFYYVEKNNKANDYKEFSYLNSNFISENIRKINLATSAKLIRLKSKNQPVIDFRDNIVLKPSELSYTFEWASQIMVVSDDKNYVFDSDDTQIVDYENDENDNNFHPKKDKGNGFNNPFLFIPSNKLNSINNSLFKNVLKSTNQIKITIPEKENVWVDSKGKITDNNQINVNSFKLGIFANLLKNQEFRNKYITDKNTEKKWQNHVNNEYFNGFDLYNFLTSYNIDIKELLKLDTSNLIIKTSDNSYKDLSSLFEILFIIQNYTDALPYEYIKANYNNPFQNIKWFYNYGKTFQNRLYASPYYINELNSNDVILEKNDFYIKNNEKSLQKIKLEFNPLTISQNTFSTQILNAFKQNIVSKIDYDFLSLEDKEQILNNFEKYNFSYQKNFNRYILNNKIIINQNPNINTQYMNKNFMKLYYGLEGKKFNFKLENLVFQSLFNNIINQYALINDNKDVWLSQAPQNIVFKATDSAINYEDLKDAYIRLSKPIIFKFDKSTFENTLQFQNKDKLTKITDIKTINKLKSAWIDNIKTQLNKIIDNFYLNTKSSDDIFVTIPINATKNHEFIKIKLPLIKEIFNTIHKKLKVEFVVVDDYEKYKILLQQNNTIYKFNNFDIFEGNSVEYLENIIKNSDNNLYNLILKIAGFEFKNSNTYFEIKKLGNFLISNKINNQNPLFKQYLQNLNTESQINLLNEINNLLSYTISEDNYIDVNSFYKVVYQKHITKPIAWNDLNYFQDIKIQK
ncbi:hypothetical protein KQ875_01675 [Mycoplasma zalophi]|uniref:Lipoprotein n=1 Tax=Mycoplasma zalophi TaxID=191287 RepID=A0ABS6DPQ4_9MOLU|nr:hypothetical protein [Mycoplasma zalophi]MBU4692304.1 hypothetical protein [Mycoplasma zalophi]